MLLVLKRNVLAEASNDTQLNVATFLDPRFMSNYITGSTELAVVKDRLVLEGSDLEFEGQGESSQQSVSADSAGQLSSAPPSTPKRRKLGSWLKLANQELESAQATNSIPVEAQIQKEVEDYLLATKPDPESNPLDWWKMHSQLYPTLAQLAKRYLCIPAASSASERVFSSSGHIVSKKRCSLKPEKVNMLVFLTKKLVMYSHYIIHYSLLNKLL